MRNKLKKSVLTLSVVSAAFALTLGLAGCKTDGSSSTTTTPSTPISSVTPDSSTQPISSQTPSSTPTPSTPEADKSVTFVNPEVTTPVVLTVGHGETVKTAYEANASLSNPTPQIAGHEAYEFAGWYIGDVKYDFNTPVTANITLTAKWSEMFYVTYGIVNGTNPTQVKVANGEKFAKPADLVDGNREFAGWYTTDGVAYDFDTPVTSALTLEGKFYYTVTFDSNGGSAVANPTVKVVYGESVAAPSDDPTLESYAFSGWYVGNTAYRFNSAVTSDITIKAKWNYVLAGEGTEVSPFVIANEADLRGFSSLVNDLAVSPEGVAYSTAYISLSADIALSDTPFTPIAGFAGVFNGNGHKISNVNIVISEQNSQVGFFASTDYAEIRLLNVEVNIIAAGRAGGSVVGGLVAYANNTSILGCNVSGNIEFNPKYNDRGVVGGIVGEGYNVVIDTCTSNFASVNASGAFDGVKTITGGSVVGGIAGRLSGEETFVSSVYSYSVIIMIRSGTFGGLVGELEEGATVAYCYFGGNIYNSNYVDSSYNTSAYYYGGGEGEFYACAYKRANGIVVSGMPWHTANWDFTVSSGATVIGYADTSNSTVQISIVDYDATGKGSVVKNVTIPFGSDLSSIGYTSDNLMNGYLATGTFTIGDFSTTADISMPVYGDLYLFADYINFTDLVGNTFAASGNDAFFFSEDTKSATLILNGTNAPLTVSLTVSKMVVEDINYYEVDEYSQMSISDSTYATVVVYLVDSATETEYRVFIQRMLDEDFEKGFLFIQEGGEGNWKLVTNKMFFVYTEYATGAHTFGNQTFIIVEPYMTSSTIYFDAYTLDGTYYTYTPYLFYNLLNGYDYNLGFTMMDGDYYYDSEFVILSNHSIAKVYDYNTGALTIQQYQRAFDVFNGVWFAENEAMKNVSEAAGTDEITDYKFYQYNDLVFNISLDLETGVLTINDKVFDTVSVGYLSGSLTLQATDTDGTVYTVYITISESFFGVDTTLVLNINYVDEATEDVTYELYDFESCYSDYLYGDFTANVPYFGEEVDADLESISCDANGITLGTNTAATYEYGYLVFASDTRTAYPALVFTVGDVTYYLAYNDAGDPVLYTPSTEAEAVDGFVSSNYGSADAADKFVHDLFQGVWIGDDGTTLVVNYTEKTVNGVPYTVYLDPNNYLAVILAFDINGVNYTFTVDKDFYYGVYGELAKEVEGEYVSVGSCYSVAEYFGELINQTYIAFNDVTLDYDSIQVYVDASGQLVAFISEMGKVFPLFVAIDEYYAPVLNFEIINEDETVSTYAVNYDRILQLVSLYDFEAGFDAGHSLYMLEDEYNALLGQYIGNWVSTDGSTIINFKYGDVENSWVMTFTFPFDGISDLPIIAGLVIQEDALAMSYETYVLCFMETESDFGLVAILQYDDGIIYEDSAGLAYLFRSEHLASYSGNWVALDEDSAYTLTYSQGYFTITGVAAAPLQIEVFGITELGGGVFYAIGQMNLDVNLDSSNNGTAVILQLQVFYINNVILVNLVEFEVSVVGGYINDTLSAYVYLEQTMFYNDVYTAFTGSFEFINKAFTSEVTSIFTFEEGFAYYNGDIVEEYTIAMDINGNLVVTFLAAVGTQEGQTIYGLYIATLTIGVDGEVTATVVLEGLYL